MDLVHVITTTGARVVIFVSQHGITEMTLQEISTSFPRALITDGTHYFHRKK